MNKAKIYAGKAADLLYPPSIYCVCCGNMIDRSRTYSLCDHCVRHIMWDMEGVRKLRDIDIIACAQYGIYERTIIFSLKYRKHRFVARSVAEMMRDKLASAGIDTRGKYLVYVPTSGSRKKERGFDHMELIARHLAGMTELTLLPDAIVRVRETRSMKGLSPQERAENVRGAFKLREGMAEIISGKDVILTDDFFTTGATAAACVEALETAAPRGVLFLAFAGKFRGRSAELK
ncbi:MAG: hypothetical protein PUB39_02835 [Eubacteriales bacterium]|nr:hypothetical protein [Eubacteriales bacterium]